MLARCVASLVVALALCGCHGQSDPPQAVVTETKPNVPVQDTTSYPGQGNPCDAATGCGDDPSLRCAPDPACAGRDCPLTCHVAVCTACIIGEVCVAAGDVDASFCVPPYDGGAPCVPPLLMPPPEPPRSSCVAGYYCADGTCTPQLSPGMPCPTPGEPFVCGGSFVCDRTATDPTVKCRPLGYDGDACYEDFDCASGHCGADGGAGGACIGPSD